MQLFDKDVRKISRFILILSIAFVFCLMFASCNKKTQTQTTVIEQDVPTEEDDNANNDIQTIDFARMEQIVTDAKTLDVEVFFAISVLHSRYIKSLEQEASALSADQREKFYIDKKNEFFKTLKFSESQYNDFMTKHVTELNNYINQYPEITQYLTTDN